MSNILLNVDQKSRPHYQPGRIRKAIGAALFIALASAAVMSGLQVKSAAAEINASSQADYLVLDEMAEYLSKQGHNKPFSEDDMQ